MLKLKKKRMEPPSGFSYVFKDGLMIRTSTWDQLVERVRAHMKINEMELPDNFAAWLEDDLCKRNPQGVCVGDGPKRFFPSRTQVVNGTNILLQFWRTGSGGVCRPGGSGAARSHLLDLQIQHRTDGLS